MNPEWYDRFIDEVRRFYPLSTKPRRNKLGDVVIGYNHPAFSAEVSEDFENLLLVDVDLAIVLANKTFSNFNVTSSLRRAALVHVAFFLGENRLNKWQGFLDAVNSENWPRAALELVNSKFYKNDPAMGKQLAERLLKRR